MKNFFSDVKTAADIFLDIRKERKQGREVEVRKVKSLPVFCVGPGLLDTVEGIVLWNHSRQVYNKIENAFKALPDEEKKRQSFSPNDGEFIERANFWKTLVSSVLPPEQSRKAMMSILQWYIHIKQLPKQAKRVPETR